VYEDTGMVDELKLLAAPGAHTSGILLGRLCFPPSGFANFIGPLQYFAIDLPPTNTAQYKDLFVQ
jgi:hypothetical protein